MQKTNPFTRSSPADRPALLVICLSLSFLLHLLVALTLPLLRQQTPNHLLTEKPTFVRLVDKPELKPKQNKPAEYELDQKPPRTEEPKPEQAKRLAERNQRVEKEQAPKGIDARDQQARQAVRVLPAPTVKPRKSQRKKSQPENKITKKKESYDVTAEKLPAEKRGAVRTPPQTEQRPKHLPTLEQLTRLAPRTLDRLAKEDSSAREKIKQRDDVAQGDEVWLNLEEGLLISFFRRFRNQIEGVWNYPVKAAENGIEGVLLLKITVKRDGVLEDVDLLNSSGSDLLDYEAIQAVYRAAPFGPLPKQYPYPEVKIYAHFSYRIANKFIYGR